MKKIIILFIICALGTLCSCSKDSDNIQGEGLLTWSGDYEVDGCGFLITINGHEYKPENESIIDNSYKTSSIHVIVEYQLLNRKIEYSCGDLPTSTLKDGIKIITIRKK